MTWSAPAALSSCAALEAPEVLFPQDSPVHATGPGAVLWRAALSCPGGEGARLAQLSAADVPGAEATPRSAGGARILLTGALSASLAPHGTLLLASATSARPGVGQLAQGRADGPFTALAAVAPPFALAHGYLGDAAVASTSAGGALGLRVERYFERRLSARAVAQSTGVTPAPRAISLALDYRTDALAVWVARNSLLARWLPASGGVHPLEHLATVSGSIHLRSLLSDNNHAIVAWAEDREGRTRVYLARSGAGVRFGAPKLLEQFHDPSGATATPVSPLLVRLSSESVMIAWAGVTAGHWVLRTAAIDQLGIGAASTIGARGDALLEDLATGPAGDAVVLWGEPQAGSDGASEPAEQALFAARGFDAYPDRTVFGAPEQVAPAGANSQASVALDPSSDGAVAVWHGAEDRLQYALRAPPGRP